MSAEKECVCDICRYSASSPHTQRSSHAARSDETEEQESTPRPEPVALTDERDIIETIELALQRGYAPGDILNENSPIRDRIRACLHEPTRAALTSAPRGDPNMRRLTGLWRFGISVHPPTCKDFYAWLDVLDAAIDERAGRRP